MSRYVVLLLSAGLVGCHIIPVEPVAKKSTDPVCPCVIFHLSAVSGHFLPYTPPGDPNNPAALMKDVLTFGADGRVHQVSTISYLQHGDSLVSTRMAIGTYSASLPIVRVQWPEAGEFVYGLRDDSLVTAVKVPRHERWTYQLHEKIGVPGSPEVSFATPAVRPRSAESAP